MHTGRGAVLSFTLPVFCLPLLAVQIYYLNYETNRVFPPPLSANLTGGGLCSMNTKRPTPRWGTVNTSIKSQTETLMHRYKHDRKAWIELPCAQMPGAHQCCSNLSLPPDYKLISALFPQNYKGLAKLSGDRQGWNRKKKTLYGSLGAKYSDLLDMHGANCNMVVLC